MPLSSLRICFRSNGVFFSAFITKVSSAVALNVKASFVSYHAMRTNGTNLSFLVLLHSDLQWAPVHPWPLCHWKVSKLNLGSCQQRLSNLTPFLSILSNHNEMRSAALPVCHESCFPPITFECKSY